jgi:hypothetical protein
MDIQNSGVIPQAAPAVRIGKFKGSLLLTKQSWAILSKDKEILWFPIMSAIVSALVIAVYILVALLISGMSGNDTGNTFSGIGSYIGLFIYYLITFFVVNFFQAGIMIIAHARMNGNNLTLGDGIRGAFRNFGKIFVWSAISATVGVILKAIADKKNLLAKIVAGLLGAAWNILTFFSLPAMIIGGTSVTDSFKSSASTIKKVWGETFIMSIGVGFIFGLIGFGGIIAAGIILVAFPKAAVAITLGIVLVIFFVVLSIISTSLSSIFKVALYEYATTGRVPEGFTPELIQAAVKK